MAIKNRRGVYTDFDPTKMVEGEFAIVQSGDPATESGEAVYICSTTGSAKRLASYTDVIRNIASEYSNQTTYTRRSLVIYNGVLYVNNVAIPTPEEWTSTKWERVYIGAQLITPGAGANSELFNEVDVNSATGTSSHAEGRQTTASGAYSHSEGVNTEAAGGESHAEGQATHATGQQSHAEGYMSTASGRASHAEGYHTTASGNNGAHSEGYETEASGQYSHAEGYEAQATGSTSHAEGYYTIASGPRSHAEGYYTTANHRSQHVFGEYNSLDPSEAGVSQKGNYVEIVGNGTATTNRSNARTLDWSGNEVLAGKLTLGAAGTDSMDAATVGRLDEQQSTIIAMLAPEFVTNKYYAPGDLVTYNGKLYRNINGGQPIAWSDNSWEEASISEALDTIYSTIATKFKASRSYSVGEYVIYNGAVYRCIEAHTANSFDASKWQNETNIGSILRSFTTQITNLQTQVANAANAALGLIAPEYSNLITYTKGDYVRRSSPTGWRLFKCISDITTTEEWTASHWIAVENVANALKTLRTYTDANNDGNIVIS